MMPAVAGVIPAAGESRRMGYPKPCLPWGGDTVLGTIVRALHSGGVRRIVVVLGYWAEQVLEAHRGLAEELPVAFVTNPEYRSGEMLASVKVGLGVLEEGRYSGFLVCPCDLPTVTPEVVGSLVAAHREHPEAIVVPTWNGRHGHPVVYPWALRDEIMNHPLQSGGLRAINHLHRDGMKPVPVRWPGVLADINTPEEYSRWLERLGGTDPRR